VYSTHKFKAESAELCDAAACSSRFARCPSPGQMVDPANSPGRVHAYFDDSTACPPPPPCGGNDCLCSCCNAAGCLDASEGVFTSGDGASCTQVECAQRFFQCPDPTSLGTANNNSATILDVTSCVYPPPPPLCGSDDCTCSCCSGDGCPAKTIPELPTHLFRAGLAADCTADACISRFEACPAKDTPDSQVKAAHTAVAECPSPPHPPPPPPPTPLTPPAPPPQSPMPAFPPSAKEVMPLWAQVVLVGSVGLLLLCAIFIWYIRKREKQNEPLWVNLANTVVAPETDALGATPPNYASSTSRPPPASVKPSPSAPPSRGSNGRQAGLELPPASD